MPLESFSFLKRDQLVNYLTSSGWKQGRVGSPSYENYTAKRLNGKTYSVLIPHLDTEGQFIDPEVLEESVQIIAAYSRIKEAELLTRLVDIQSSSDMLSLRVSDVEDAASFGLSRIIEVLKDTSDYLLYTAESFQGEPQPFYKKPSERSWEFIESCRMSHTTRGSFGLTIEIPLTFPHLRLDGEIVFGRKVSETAIENIAMLQNAISEQRIDAMLENPHLGINYNTCMALLGILDNIDANNRALTCSLLPSTELRLSNGTTSPIKHIDFKKEYAPHLFQIAEALKPKDIEDSPTVEEVAGYVLGLSIKNKKSELDEEVPDVIKIRDHQNGRTIRIVGLTLPEYWVAHAAQIRRKQIKVTGLLERTGNYFTLKEPRKLEEIEK